MGIFRVYEDSNLIAEVPNVITAFGKRELLRILSGQGNRINTMLVGADSTAALDTNTSLWLPIASEKVIYSTPVGSTKLVFKSRLNESVGGLIHEMAVSNDQISKATKLVNIVADSGTATYDPSTVFVAGEGASASVRVSPVGVSLANSTALNDYYTYNTPISILGALDSDTIALSGYNSAATAATFTVRFTDSSGVTATKTGVTTPASTAYSVTSFALSSMTIGGGFSKGDIVKTEIFRTDSNAVTSTIDGLVLRSEAVGGTIIARAVTGTGIAKRRGSKMDIEYEIPVTFT